MEGEKYSISTKIMAFLLAFIFIMIPLHDLLIDFEPYLIFKETSNLGCMSGFLF